MATVRLKSVFKPPHHPKSSTTHNTLFSPLFPFFPFFKAKGQIVTSSLRIYSLPHWNSGIFTSSCNKLSSRKGRWKQEVDVQRSSCFITVGSLSFLVIFNSDYELPNCVNKLLKNNYILCNTQRSYNCGWNQGSVQPIGGKECCARALPHTFISLKVITHARLKSGRGVGLLAPSVCVCVCVCLSVCSVEKKPLEVLTSNLTSC